MALENVEELIDLLGLVWGYLQSDILLVEGLDGQLFRQSHVTFGQGMGLDGQNAILAENLKKSGYHFFLFVFCSVETMRIK